MVNAIDKGINSYGQETLKINPEGFRQLMALMAKLNEDGLDQDEIKLLKALWVLGNTYLKWGKDCILDAHPPHA